MVDVFYTGASSLSALAAFIFLLPLFQRTPSARAPAFIPLLLHMPPREAQFASYFAAGIHHDSLGR